MEISRKIYLLRTESGLTQSEFAKIAGVTDKAVSAWEQGKRDPKIKYIKPVCNHFGIDVNSFIDETSDIYKSSLPSNITPLAPMKKVPLVGQIACGTPILAEQNITDYIDLPRRGPAPWPSACRRRATPPGTWASGTWATRPTTRGSRVRASPPPPFPPPAPAWP